MVNFKFVWLIIFGWFLFALKSVQCDLVEDKTITNTTHHSENIVMPLMDDVARGFQNVPVPFNETENWTSFDVNDTSKTQFFVDHKVLPPDEFDARVHWPHCHSIRKIYHQSRTATSWAVSTASAISDRICIASNGTIQVTISSYDLINCCKTCRFSESSNDGSAKSAWNYYILHGVVTGSEFPTSACMDTGCKPYPYPPCGMNTTRECPRENYVDTKKCDFKCSLSHDKTSYNEDKHFGLQPVFTFKRIKEIQLEIMKNGPLTADIEIYEDFKLAKNETYYAESTKLVGHKTIKILGWGIDQLGTTYWLCANTWGTGFGEDGFFKIPLYGNACKIRENIYGAWPKLF